MKEKVLKMKNYQRREVTNKKYNKKLILKNDIKDNPRMVIQNYHLDTEA